MVAASAPRAVLVGDGPPLPGVLTLPAAAFAVVAFAHGSDSSRLSPRNRTVAAELNRAGIATLLFDLLTPEEAGDRRNVFDIELLARRVEQAAAWMPTEMGSALPLGIFGASTGAAAALVAAARMGAEVGAVVSRGGRPDLAGDHLATVRAPTLLVVGGRDEQVLELNRRAAARMGCEVELAIVPGAGHLFSEPGALEAVAQRAAAWFTSHLIPR